MAVVISDVHTLLNNTAPKYSICTFNLSQVHREIRHWSRVIHLASLNTKMQFVLVRHGGHVCMLTTTCLPAAAAPMCFISCRPAVFVDYCSSIYHRTASRLLIKPGTCTHHCISRNSPAPVSACKNNITECLPGTQEGVIKQMLAQDLASGMRLVHKYLRSGYIRRALLG